MPTPIKAATRAMPELTTIAKRPRHGLMICISVPSVVAQPTEAAVSAIASVAAAASTSIVSRLSRSRADASTSTKSTSLLALFGLRPHQLAVGTVAADQLGMAAAFDNSALVEHEDAVGADYA